ncbi:MAG: site-specific integrase, partial [Clostridiales bacterium]|nr:site-specific integrase [Clostridiales bacterium]
LKKLRSEYGGEGEDYVVRTREPGPVNTGRLRVQLCRRSEKAGLGRITPRILRDTYAMHAIRAGATSDVVAELMGFASAQQVTKRYMSGSPRGKRELVERMYEEDMGT